MLFSNLHPTDEILQTGVNTRMITLSVKEFGEMLGLPREDTMIKIGD